MFPAQNTPIRHRHHGFSLYHPQNETIRYEPHNISQRYILCFTDGDLL